MQDKDQRLHRVDSMDERKLDMQLKYNKYKDLHEAKNTARDSIDSEDDINAKVKRKKSQPKLKEMKSSVF